jgi:CubicO group peptidase (beta-lactamase class C family)
MSFPYLRMLFPLLLAGCATSNVGQVQGEQSDAVYMGELFFSPDDEAVYQQRYEISVNRTKKGELYDTFEDILGAPQWTPLPAAEPMERTIDDEALREATDYAASNNSSALIVWRNDKIETDSYFGTESRTSPINSFSLAKPITALAVGRAIMLGKIQSLDQPVADFVEEWRDDPLRNKILVRHLLDMRSGFLRQGFAVEHGEIMARSFLHPRSEEILIKEYPVIDEPGTRYEYNNAASSMVAILIERATGRRYAEFIGTEILQKIGAQGGRVWVNRKGGLAHAGCCMLLPAETYLRLAILTLHDGVWEGQRLLPEFYVAEMKRPTAENPYYGMGVYVVGRYTERRGWANPDLPLPKILHSEPYLAADLYLFDGNMNQVVYVIPSKNLVILRTGGAPPRNDDTEWDNVRLPNLIMRGIIGEK